MSYFLSGIFWEQTSRFTWSQFSQSYACPYLTWCHQRWVCSLFCTVHPLIELSPRFYHQQLVSTLTHFGNSCLHPWPYREQRQVLSRWPFSLTWSFGNTKSTLCIWFLSSKWWDYSLCTYKECWKHTFQVHVYKLSSSNHVYVIWEWHTVVIVTMESEVQVRKLFLTWKYSNCIWISVVYWPHLAYMTGNDQNFSI